MRGGKVWKSIPQLRLLIPNRSQIWTPAMPRTLLKVFGGGGGLESESSVHLWSEASA